MCNNEATDCKCISEILTVIAILQKNAICPESCLDTCDRGFLGCSVTTAGCNTRPIMLYTCCGNGTPWSMPITKDATATCTGSSATCSNVFRVEKIEGNCCTFRVLADNTDETSVYPYVATNVFFTMDCDCLCCIRCLSDTYVDCLC